MMVQSMNEVGLTPTRSEKLVITPFTALLRGRSCGGSRGRSSTRSNPMFSVRSMNSRNGSPLVEIFDGKDPGSPKVTCIGQVRIKKKKKKKTKLDSSSCRCFNGTALFWSPFSSIDETRVARPPQLRSWRRWLSCSSGWSHQKKNSEAEEEETNGGDVGIRFSPDRFGGEIEKQVREEEEHAVVWEEEVAKKGFVPTTPPKNALLLMRCRSAPHRTSSLAVAVAVSDQTKTDPIGDNSVDKTDGDDDETNDIINPDNQVSGRSCEGSSRVEEEEETSTPSPTPLILTRSKSAPARETAKLAVAETNSSHLRDIDNSNSSNIDKIGKGKRKKDSSSSTTLLFLLLSDDSCGSSRGTVLF